MKQFSQTNLSKQTIVETLDHDVDYDGLELHEVLERIHSIIEKFGDKYHKIYFSSDGWYNEKRIDILGVRFETDAEYETRLEKLKQEYEKIRQEKAKKRKKRKNRRKTYI